MSDENTHAVPDSSQEPEQRRNIEPKAAENSANPEIIQEEPHKRKRNYVPKTPQECERSKILKRGSTPLRERFMSDMQYNSLSKATQKNYLNAVFDFIAHYYKSPEKISDEEIRKYFNYEINVRHLSTYSLMVHRAALLFLYEKTLNLSRPFLHIFHPKKDKRHREILSQQEGCHTPLRPFLSCFSLCGTVFVPFNPVSYLDCSSVLIGLLVSGTFRSPFLGHYI